MYAKAIESIHRFGFVDPLTCRTEVNAAGVIVFEIIDGEHRWKAAKDHGRCTRAKKGGGWERHVGLAELPVTNLGVVIDSVAQQLTIVLNETRGEYKPKEMGVLLTKLLTVEPLPDLLEVLPFTKPQFEELAELPSVDWNKVGSTALSTPKRQDQFVERVYRLPTEAAQKIDEAIVAWRDREGESGGPDWKALQAIAEEFLGA